MAVELRPGRGPSPAQLSRTFLALTSVPVFSSQFFVCLLVFIAVLYGSVARGAFYQSGLEVFLVFAVGAAAAAVVCRRGKVPVRWWMVSAAPVVVAVLASAVAAHELWAVGDALAPVGAAAGLGIAGCVAGRLADRLVMLRLIVDAALLTAVLCWLGLAWHIPSLAQLLSDGWRAAGPIGYPNVTGLVLLIGLICASAVAAISGHAADEVRCWLLATGVLATQSRSVVLAALACAAVLWFTSPSVVRVLGRCSLWALVAFAGLLPSVRGQGDGGLVATAALVVALGLLLWRPALPSTLQRRRAVLVAVLAAGLAGLASVVLRGRILDGGSDDGRVQLWLNAIRQLRWGGFFGSGPAQVAELSRGELVTLLAHSDPLQYAGYYGIPGVAALLFIGLRAGLLLAHRHGGVPGEMWAAGLTVTIAVACVMFVDFPLEVPLVPALACLAIGAAVGVPEPGTASPGRASAPEYPGVAEPACPSGANAPDVVSSPEGVPCQCGQIAQSQQ